MAKQLSNDEKFYAVRDALESYTDAWHFISNAESPLRIELNGKKYALQLNLTHDAYRSNPDECRIQTNDTQINKSLALVKEGYEPVILGFHPPTQVFSMWETASWLIPRGKTFSMYSRYKKLEEAAEQDISRYRYHLRVIEKDTICINFVSSLLGVMIQNNKRAFNLKEKELRDLPKELEARPPVIRTTGTGKSTPVVEDIIMVGREKITISRTAYARNPKFKYTVLQHYDYSCCVCGLQLNMVEAAHIIPHNHEDCRDVVQNGLALCSQHHRAYDSGLLIPDEDYKIRINRKRASFLKSIKRAEGLNLIEAYNEKKIKLPNEKSAWPKPEFLRQGRRARTVA